MQGPRPRPAYIVFAFAILTLACAGLPGAQSIEGRAEEPALSTWTIYMRAFGYESSNSPVLSINRRTGPRSDVGLQLDADFDSHHDENETHVYPTADSGDRIQDTDAVHLWIHGETRRWKFLSPRVSSWCGLRVSVGYGRSDSDQTSRRFLNGVLEETTYEKDQETLDAGLSLTCGAQIELLRHVAVAAALAPLRYCHHWSKTVTDEERSGEYRFSRDEGWERWYEFETSLSAAAYLVLRF